MLIALGSSLVWAQDCPATTADLERAVADADRAFATMDLARFSAAEQATDQRLRCLTDALTPAQAAGAHRVRALAAFVAEDPVCRVGVVAIVRVVDPPVGEPRGAGLLRLRRSPRWSPSASRQPSRGVASAGSVSSQSSGHSTPSPSGS